MPFIEELNHYVGKIKEHPFVLRGDFRPIFEEYRDSKCVVDLGCGNGHFLRDYLSLHPHLIGVGVERRFKRVFKTAEKLAEEQHEARVVQGDIHEFLEGSPSNFWEEVWIQFPDPWPKLKHEKHRMLHPLSFQQIHRILKPGGRFCFRSDCREYWEFLQNENQRTGLFPTSRILAGDLYNEEPKTLYQQKFVSRNIPIYSVEFRKYA